LLLHESNRALANSLVTASDLLRQNGRWREARDIGWQAYQLQQAEGGETTNFLLGMLQTERNAPIEVNRYSDYVIGGVPIMAAYFSADGRTVQFPLANGVVDTFDPVTGRIVRTMGLKYSWGQNTCVARSSDGRYLYRHARIFTPGELPCRFERLDLNNGNVQKTDLANDFQEVHGTIATDGTDVVACLIENTKIKQDQRDLWMISLTDSEKPRVLTVPSGRFTTAISFSPDLHTLAVGNTKGVVDLYKAEANPQPQPLAEFDLADAAGFDGVERINQVPDGSGMVLADRGGKLGFISLKSAPEFRKFGECDSKVEVIGFSRDSRFVLTGDDSGAVGLWDITTGKRLRAFYADQRIAQVEMSPDQHVLIAVTLYGQIFTWPVDLLDEDVLSRNGEAISQFAASSDGLLAATAMEDRVQVYDVPTHRLLRRLKANGNVTSMAFSKTSSMLKVATDAGEISQTDVFDSNSKGPDVELVGPTIYSAEDIPGRKHAVFLTPDGGAAIDLTDVTAARIDLATGYQTSIRRTLAGAAAGISNDGYTVITIPSVGQYRRTFCLYDFLGQKQREIPVEEMYALTAIAISSDGKTSYLGLSDGRLQARDLADGKVLWQSASHQRNIRCIRVSPGGHTLLSGGDDGTLQLWDAQSGNNLRTVADGLSKISAVYFSPGGDLILCNGAPGDGACIWELSQAQLPHEAAAAASRALLAIKGNPGNDSAALTLVDWYTRRGMAEWARDLLDQRSLDQRGGLAAARCRLKLHDDDSAGPDFKALVGQQIPGVSDAYLETCSRAAKVVPF
jgi:WD40 repeat protein